MSTTKRIFFIFILILICFIETKAQQDTSTSMSKNVNEVVVTGTKTPRKKLENPVMVNVIDMKTLQNTQACNLSEGLKFQVGLRVETDCQTCNYTQLRMNGLQGGYSQILINGRPTFSALMSLYGLEQLPVNLIDRIEIVKGSGSSLYGSAAIGGTVNVITKLPKKSSFDMGSTLQLIGGNAIDWVNQGNISWVNDSKNSGVNFYLSHRKRDFYDHNKDSFSELPKIESYALGFGSFFKINENQKIEFSGSLINEYRFGGQMIEPPAFKALQSEERQHNIAIFGTDYQWNFKNEKGSLIFFGAYQYTKRNHFTGVMPDSNILEYFANPPYGNSDMNSFQLGGQLNYLIPLLNKKNVFSIGVEYNREKVNEQIPSYNFFVNQTVTNLGAFIQSDWEIMPKVNVLTGLRIDKHSFLSNAVLSPRMAMVYKFNTNTQFRLGLGRGFRAPQAYDTDLHVAFAGGGVSRIQLYNQLVQEKSNSYSFSINYDKPLKNIIFGGTIDGFLTRLNDVFVYENIGVDSFGEVFEKRNGQTAIVRGLSLELRANYNRIAQIEMGMTIQESYYKQPVLISNSLPTFSSFLRTPNFYGFANLSINPSSRLMLNFNAVYTGSMHVLHLAQSDNLQDQLVQTPSFIDVSSKISYKFSVSAKALKLEVFGGIKNMFNSYQSDFDSGKNRDSNYIYGPSLPRAIYVGLKLIDF
jgi:outer membrane receptor for ferrienterochelin and colicins